MHTRLQFALVSLLAAGAAVLVPACSSTTGLPAAVDTNKVDTVSLYALRGTSVALPSAYELQGKLLVRTDETTALDFAFDFDSIGQPALYPTGAIGLGTGSGLLVMKTLFSQITSAPTGGYEFATPIALDTGTIIVVAGRPTVCLFGATVSLYAKLRVLAVDSTARRLDLQILTDDNCGYRGLAPGLPTQ
jgi:hypothetical protein